MTNAKSSAPSDARMKKPASKAKGVGPDDGIVTRASKGDKANAGKISAATRPKSPKGKSDEYTGVGKTRAEANKDALRKYASKQKTSIKSREGFTK